MFVSFWMSQKLTREIHNLEKEITDKQIELEHYQNYAGRLGGSENMNISNIAGLAAELIPRATMFAQYADQASSMSAMQNLQMMKMTGRVPIANNVNMQMQIEMSAFNQFKQEAMKALKQQEVNVMNEKEKEIQLALNDLQQRLTIKRQQKEAYQKHAEEEAKDMAPKF